MKSHLLNPELSVVEMQEIEKSFSGIQVLHRVNLHVKRGECLALLGENGAGKSTLMKILGGIYHKDAGKILIDGKEVDITSTTDAQRLGIAFIHQELNLIEYLTVAENIYLGREEMRHGFLIDDAKAVEESRRHLAKIKANINPRSLIVDLTTGEKQLVEIARALAQDAKVLVMDEPTASLSNNEIGVLFTLIQSLKEQGVGIIYISHRLEEIYEIADSVLVLRNGYEAGETSGRAPVSEIVAMMLGRELGDRFQKPIIQIGEPIFEVQHLSVRDTLRNINLQVNQGEILGIFGIAGAGQRDLALALFGLRPLLSGKFFARGKEVSIRSPADAIAHGLGLLTESRKEDGLVLNLSILDNITLSYLDRIAVGGYIRGAAEKSFGQYFYEKLNIKAVGLNQKVRFLSGGNQQKVVLARALSTSPDVIILNEPTRGVDVGSKVEIYQLMNQQILEAKGLILISSELPEILGMSDRILVLYHGTFVAEFSAEEATQEKLLTYAMGGTVNNGNN